MSILTGNCEKRVKNFRRYTGLQGPLLRGRTSLWPAGAGFYRAHLGSAGKIRAFPNAKAGEIPAPCRICLRPRRVQFRALARALAEGGCGVGKLHDRSGAGLPPVPSHWCKAGSSSLLQGLNPSQALRSIRRPVSLAQQTIGACDTQTRLSRSMQTATITRKAPIPCGGGTPPL